MTTTINNSIRSKVAQLANNLFYNAGLTQSQAWAKAWKVIKLKEEMQKGEVSFSFEKADGTERQATGTTHASYLPQSKGSTRKTPLHQIIYFDVLKNGYRSFKAQNIISVSE